MSAAAHVATLGEGIGGGHGHAAGLTEHAGHAAAKRIVVAYGFWIFLISDIIVFAAFFATYAVLTDATAGGPSGRELFSMTTVGFETACLLVSTVFCGIAGVAAQAVPLDDVVAVASERARALAGKAGPTLGAIKEQMYAGPLALLRERRS